MNEIMNLAEVEKQFDGEWVLVEDPEIDQNNEVVKGTVVYHSKSRDDVYRKAKQLRPKRSAFLYNGPAPDNILINL